MTIERQRIFASGEVFRKGDDMLQTMFEAQAKFHSRMHPQFQKFPGKECERLLCVTARNIIMEGAELMDSLPWKEWKKNYNETDWEQVKYEIADIMAFLMNAAIEAGMTHEDLFNYYMRKVEINVKRQEAGY